MNHVKLERAAYISYAVIVVLFLCFFIYLGCFEGVTLAPAPPSSLYYGVQNYTYTEIQDAEAPAGIRQEYRWIYENSSNDDTHLSFYLVHQFSSVYLDDQLVYSLQLSDSNILAHSPGNYWATVPLSHKDIGKEIRVVITPAFRTVVDRHVNFGIGSLFTLYRTQLMTDMPQILLAAGCIFLGFLISFVALFFIFSHKSRIWDTFFLGNFTIMLGLWKITDTCSSPMLFPENPMLLSYITLGILTITPIPMTLYFKAHLFYDDPLPILRNTLFACFMAFVILFTQFFQLAELRELLFLIHIVIIVSLVYTLASSLRKTKKKPVPHPHRTQFFIILLAVGVGIDMVSFYKVGSASSMKYSVITFLIYTSATFIFNILETNKKAYTDSLTGLYNKSFWDNMMDNPKALNAPSAIVMLDLNGLKYVNDNMGHRSGDELITDFAGILRNTAPTNGTVCRWGGDEFTIYLPDITPEKLRQYLDGLDLSILNHNRKKPQLPIHYAIGYVLSTEFPDFSRPELLRKADQRMYTNKSDWYSRNSFK